MNRFFSVPARMIAAAFSVLGLAAGFPVMAAPSNVVSPQAAAPKAADYFAVQVVGLQWLNPLQRCDYPTEWQLLWTLGLAEPNAGDDRVRAEPWKFSMLQSMGDVVAASNEKGAPSFSGFHAGYAGKIAQFFRHDYFSNDAYFYTVKPANKSKWRELAGIHVEYALPKDKLDPAASAKVLRDSMVRAYDIGDRHAPGVWTRGTPPDVRVSQADPDFGIGDPNAGFVSLIAALTYLRAHPKETVWLMSWDAPGFPQVGLINENMVLLVLAGPDFDTGREPLAWFGYPASRPASYCWQSYGKPSCTARGWMDTLDAAASHVGKVTADIGYVIHDTGNSSAEASKRIDWFGEALTAALPGLDAVKQVFDTPARLGEMGAGTALTDVALGIAYANHFGRPVLVAGTTNVKRPLALVIAPPAKVRPVRSDQDWFRARGENDACLPWWGLRRDAPLDYPQGYSR